MPGTAGREGEHPATWAQHPQSAWDALLLKANSFCDNNVKYDPFPKVSAGGRGVKQDTDFLLPYI